MEKFVKKLPIIRQDISKLLMSSAIAPEDIRKIFADEKIDNNFVYCFSNRKDYIADIFDALNSQEQNLILLTGFQGTGKTTIIEAINASLEENVLFFYYEFTQISNLDDIILSLYRYLKKYFIKDPEYSRSEKLSGNQSIDERLISYLKNLKRPLLVVLDGFENIFKIKSESVDNELHNFINYLLSTQFVKIIISGRKNSVNFNTNKDNILSIRLGGLDESDALKILDDNDLDCSQSTLFQLFEITRGYPDNLMLFITAVKILGMDAFEVIKNYAVSNDSFEEYIINLIYNQSDSNSKKLAWYFSLIRHYIDLEALEKLNLFEEPDKLINYLRKCNILTESQGSYYIKNGLKDYIYKSIPYFEKINIHKYWHELYAEQITKKLEDRYFPISRKLLHSEQYYHYICLTKLDKNFNVNNSNKIKYMSDIHLVSLMSEKEKPEKKQKTNISVSNNEDNYDIIENGLIDNNSSHNEYYADSDLTIELTEEEKKLLGDETDNEDTADDLVEKQLDQASEPDNIEDLRAYYLNAANSQKIEGNADFILTNLKKAYEISEELNDNNSLANISASIANVLRETNKLEDAVDYYNKGYQLFTSINDNINALQIILQLANIYNECFKHDTALQYYHRILDSQSIISNPKTVIEALIGIGEIHDYREELNLALRFYKEAYDKSLNIEDKEIKSTICFKLALVYDDMKDIDNALLFYKKSIEICSDYNTNPNLSSSYANIAAIYEEIDNKNNAKEFYIKSLEIDQVLNSWEDQFKTLSRLGNIYFESKNIREAFNCFYKELAISKLINDPYLKAMSFLDLGDLYFYQKNYEKAVKAFILARKTIGNTISTDSREKIERRFRQVISVISEEKFNEILKSLTKKESL